MSAVEKEVASLKTHREHDNNTGQHRGAALIAIQEELAEIRMMLHTQYVIRRVLLWIGGLVVTGWWAIKTGDLSRFLQRIFPG